MALINCNECGHQISDKAFKCVKCGTPIVKKQLFKCFECGTQIENEANPCPNCGAEQDANPAKSEPIKNNPKIHDKQAKVPDLKAKVELTTDEVPTLSMPKRKLNRKLFIFLVIFFIAALAGILIGLSNRNFDSSSSYETFVETEEPIPPPPLIKFTVSNHKKKFLKELFKDCNLSGDKRQLVQACNYLNSTVRNKAVSIAGQDEGLYNLGQICDIFDYCYNNWKYVNDPTENEIIEYASNTISNGMNGDCDDFAVLLCSMILSIGGEARINFAYGQDGGHAFTEVNIGKSEVEEYISKRYKKVYDSNGIWKRTDEEDNNWLNLDWFAKHPGGRYYDYMHGTSFYIIQEYCSDFTK